MDGGSCKYSTYSFQSASNLRAPAGAKSQLWPSYTQIRAQKGEDEVAELDAKAKQLETELDLTAEKLGYVSLQANHPLKSSLQDLCKRMIATSAQKPWNKALLNTNL